MISDHERRLVISMPAAAQAPHRLADFQQPFDCGGAERDQHLWRDDLDLLGEKRQAGGHFVRRRWAIAGRARGHVWPTFENVGDVNFFAAKAHRADDFG